MTALKRFLLAWPAIWAALLLAARPLYYNSTCINMYVKQSMFNRPTVCGFLGREFLVCLGIALALSLIAARIFAGRRAPART